MTSLSAYPVPCNHSADTEVIICGGCVVTSSQARVGSAGGGAVAGGAIFICRMEKNVVAAS